MRLSLGLILGLLLGLPPMVGCGPAIPPEDLGVVLEEVPEIPGAEESFEFPESGSSATPGAETLEEETPEPDPGP